MARRFPHAPLAVAATLAVAGCGTERAPGFEAALPPPPVATSAPADGSIARIASGYAPLYSGRRAAAVGDPVTVVLVESLQTTKSANAKTSRNGGISLAPPSAGPFAFDPGILNSSGQSSFKGQGNATQSSSIRGEITVTIAEVRPNGTAFVRGEKLLRLSQGEEWVQLSGIVRLSDIEPDNRVLSPRIADARITYSGKGAVQQSSREGWLSRFFNLVTPF